MMDEKSLHTTKLPFNQVMERTAMAIGGMSRQTISKYSKGGVKETPDKKSTSRGNFAEMDEMAFDIVRRSIYGFYENRVAPSVKQSLNDLKARTRDTDYEFPYELSTLRLIIKKLGFKHVVNQGNRILFMEKFNIQCWRIEYR